MPKALWTQLPAYKAEREFRPPKKIKRETPERAKENRKYRQEVKEFLILPRNRFCWVTILMDQRSRPATQVHHQRGRQGKLLLDKRWWVPVSKWGHDWIHNNPLEAKALGLLAGPWNDQPGQGIPGLSLKSIISRKKI